MKTVVLWLRKDRHIAGVEKTLDYVLLDGVIVRDRQRRRTSTKGGRRASGRSPRNRSGYVILLSPESFKKLLVLEAIGYGVGSYETHDFIVIPDFDPFRIEILR